MHDTRCGPDGVALAVLVRGALKSQYHATLAMLRDAIERCPESAWSATDGGAPFWRVAYHALYYTHLYLQRDDTAFRPWERHQTGIQDLDDVPAPTELRDLLEPPGRYPRTGAPYTRDELLAYWDACDRMVDPEIDAFDVLAPETGFRWHHPQRPKLEQHIASVRHIQHHAGQLSARMRHASVDGVEWVGTKR